MLKHYKKLLLFPIPLLVLFFLVLALGSSEQPCELCQLCQNKALVKEAILAVYENPDDPNLPEQFDPNYIQCDPEDTVDFDRGETPSIVFAPRDPDKSPPKFRLIIAEGDMVSVRVVMYCGDASGLSFDSVQLAIFRIANGKIVRGTISGRWYTHYTLREPYW